VHPGHDPDDAGRGSEGALVPVTATRASDGVATPRWPGDRGGHVWPKDREVVTDDGARIRYTVRGEVGAGPPIVLCSGFICPDNFWAHLGSRLMERHPVVVLNYRGVGASTEPRPPGYRAWRLRPEDFTTARLAADVASVLDAEGLTGAAAIGHSMGTQVALQLWRDRPDLVDALVLVAGPYASPLRTFYGTDIASSLFPLVRYGAPLLPRPVQRQALKSLRLPVALPVARLIRALGPHTPDAGMALYRRHFGEVDPQVVLLTAEGMHRFDAGPWLHDIDVPVQVLIGTADTWAPPSIGEALLEQVRDLELSLVAEGSHGVPIEFPAELHDAVARFLHQRLGAPAVVPTGRADIVSPPRRSRG
jgi:pimeloyl-ACP methyl ester carboxylesterase